MSIKKDVRALHILLSYHWEDAGVTGVVELNEEQVGEMLDLINSISDQLEDADV